MRSIQQEPCEEFSGCRWHLFRSCCDLRRCITPGIPQNATCSWRPLVSSPGCSSHLMRGVLGQVLREHGKLFLISLRAPPEIPDLPIMVEMAVYWMLYVYTSMHACVHGCMQACMQIPCTCMHAYTYTFIISYTPSLDTRTCVPCKNQKNTHAIANMRGDI